MATCRRALGALARAGVVGVLGASVLAPVASAASGDTYATPIALASVSAGRPAVELPLVGDDHPNAYEQRRRDLRDSALQLVLDGTATPGDAGVVAVPGRAQSASGPAPSPHAEVARAGVDQVFALLVDFGSGDYGDRTWNGPTHGQLPSPNRSTDNVSVDIASSSPAHYASLLFDRSGPSLASYLRGQSGGSYTVRGAVHGWVTVPGNAATYGADFCTALACSDRTGALVADAFEAFVAGFYAQEPTGDLAEYLRSFDRWDRYDRDADGRFDEPDGLIDHVAIFFAGSAEPAGERTDALRSRFGHVVSAQAEGVVAPAGRPIGSTGLAVDTYTLQPENAALGQVAHLFGHDLGLADLSDPGSSDLGGLEAAQPDVEAGGSPLPPGTDSNVGFWSLMGGGSQLGTENGLGTQPGGLLAWERLQLGWARTAVVSPGTVATLELSPVASRTADRVDAVVVPVTGPARVERLADPPVGQAVFAATVGPSADAVLSRPLDGQPGVVSWRQWLDVEPRFDPLRVQVAVGDRWVDLVLPVSGSADWRLRSAEIPQGSSELRFWYATDLALTGRGVLLDDIRITPTGSSSPATPVVDGAENGLQSPWTSAGWTVGDGSVQIDQVGRYLVERRSHAGADRALEAAPYVADLAAGSRWVDHFPYSAGVLVTYWDGSVRDNAVSAHPSAGRLLVVDARPESLLSVTGAPAPSALAPADASFGLSWTHGFAVTAYGWLPNGEPEADTVRVRASAPVPEFDDTDLRWSTPGSGQPRLPSVGVTVTVLVEPTTPTGRTTVQVTGAPRP